MTTDKKLCEMNIDELMAYDRVHASDLHVVLSVFNELIRRAEQLEKIKEAVKADSFLLVRQILQEGGET